MSEPACCVVLGTMAVHLMLNARNLSRLRPSIDPFALVYLKKDSDKDELLERTKTIISTSSPIWTEVITVRYDLHKPSYIRVEILDEHQDGKAVLVGKADFEIGAVLGSKGSIKERQLEGGGTIVARVAKASIHDLGIVFLNLRAENIIMPKAKTLLKKPKPKLFYELASVDDAAGYGIEWKTVIRSAVIKSDLSPSWEVQTVPVDHLCGGEFDRTLRLSILQKKKNGNNQVVGILTTTLTELLDMTGNKRFLYIKNGKGKVIGEFFVALGVVDGATDTPTGYIDDNPLNKQPSIRKILTPDVPDPTFIDYIRGGCNLNLHVAIDFTESNGDNSEPGSLHYIYPDGNHNEYEKAITAIGSTIAKYNWDQIFSVWGFGGKMGGKVNDFFQVGLDSQVQGIDGILESYHDIFESDFEMGSKTILAATIAHTTDDAQKKWDKALKSGALSYTVLLILTNGDVKDTLETQEALLKASHKPISVIIIGIGDGKEDNDFESMRFLDDFATSVRGERDVTNFVEFQKYKDDMDGFMAACLEELPDQLEEYCLAKDIFPPPHSLHSSHVPTPEGVETSQAKLTKEESMESYGSHSVADSISYIDRNSFTGENELSTLKREDGEEDYNETINLVDVTKLPLRNSLVNVADRTRSMRDLYRPNSFRMKRHHSLPCKKKPYFLVIPSGAIEGGKIQVQHRETKKMMIYTVPIGAKPGDSVLVECD